MNELMDVHNDGVANHRDRKVAFTPESNATPRDATQRKTTRDACVVLRVVNES